MKDNFDIIGEDAFSNTEDAPAATAGAGTAGGKVSSDTINAGIEAGTQLIGLFANRQKNEMKQKVKAACGHKPLFGKAKKSAYQKCAQNVITPPVDYSKMYQAPPKSNTGLYIGLAAGAVILTIIGVVVINKMNKPVVVSPNVIAK